PVGAHGRRRGLRAGRRAGDESAPRARTQTAPPSSSTAHEQVHRRVATHGKDRVPQTRRNVYVHLTSFTWQRSARSVGGEPCATITPERDRLEGSTFGFGRFADDGDGVLVHGLHERVGRTHRNRRPAPARATVALGIDVDLLATPPARGSLEPRTRDDGGAF